MSRTSRRSSRRTIDAYRSGIDSSLKEINRNCDNMRLEDVNRRNDIDDILGDIKGDFQSILNALDGLSFDDDGEED